MSREPVDDGLLVQQFLLLLLPLVEDGTVVVGTQHLLVQTPLASLTLHPQFIK